MHMANIWEYTLDKNCSQASLAPRHRKGILWFSSSTNSDQQNNTEQEKLSKMKSLLPEENLHRHSKSGNQWRGEAKLQQKLLYLQFYEDY